jgi:rubrerythrin
MKKKKKTKTITPVRINTSAGVEWRCPDCDHAVHPLDKKCPGCKAKIA